MLWVLDYFAFWLSKRMCAHQFVYHIFIDLFKFNFKSMYLFTIGRRRLRIYLNIHDVWSTYFMFIIIIFLGPPSIASVLRAIFNKILYVFTIISFNWLKIRKVFEDLLIWIENYLFSFYSVLFRNGSLSLFLLFLFLICKFDFDQSLFQWNEERKNPLPTGLIFFNALLTVVPTTEIV